MTSQKWGTGKIADWPPVFTTVPVKALQGRLYRKVHEHFYSKGSFSAIYFFVYFIPSISLLSTNLLLLSFVNLDNIIGEPFLGDLVIPAMRTQGLKKESTIALKKRTIKY